MAHITSRINFAAEIDTEIDPADPALGNSLGAADGLPPAINEFAHMIVSTFSIGISAMREFIYESVTGLEEVSIGSDQ